MPAGYTIRVTTQPGSAGAPVHEFFPEEAVRIAAKVLNGTRVEVVGRLRPFG